MGSFFMLYEDVFFEGRRIGIRDSIKTIFPLIDAVWHKVLVFWFLCLSMLKFPIEPEDTLRCKWL